MQHTYFPPVDLALAEKELARVSSATHLLLSENLQKLTSCKASPFSPLDPVSNMKRAKKSVAAHYKQRDAPRTPEAFFKFGSLFSVYDHLQEFANRLAAGAEL